MAKESITRICSVDDCEFIVDSLGLCSRHYQRYCKYGDVHYVAKRHPHGGQTAKERFWGNVAITSDDSRCWEWQGSVSPKHYGEIYVDGRRWGIHRYAWFLANGREPLQWILHTCDNTRCVNPKHLYEGTPQQNVRDKVERNRQQKGEGVPSAKLTADDVVHIRRLLRAGRSTDERIGEQFGVTRKCITHIRIGKTWKHVPLEDYVSQY